ncbi:DUF1015 domain-containing protein [Youxingia wuxianensis]|uniref:DUF1015 domain-containing protein n=1 Tax=Youxingia wuxianensis TaxID=2763678 RepID=A0A926ETT6_9FIRM|nr:DUF1015 domain-containing protein [Youxingia wuxianensis]MBC8586477.1 DUF1015 domain-containing protein [Youxingia wuxianensis]
MRKIGFSPADILLPKGVDMSRWSVVACDQYTSEPEYWERVENYVGDAPSTLHMVLPEAYLGSQKEAQRIKQANEWMERYLNEGLLETLPESYLYVQRTLPSGAVRHGLIGKVDLEEYDYTAHSQSLIRATEGTVLDRLPPRIRVREHARLELPHIMLLLDDMNRTVIEPLEEAAGQMQVVYDFPLMENGGKIKGWQLTPALARQVEQGLETLLAQMTAYGDHRPGGQAPLLFAVGDGNHSLATAKACFEKLKETMPASQWENHPARYALVELVNVHDQALEFEPIHRVVFGVDPSHVLKEFEKYYEICIGDNGGQKLWCVTQQEERPLYISNPASQLAVGSLQKFLDDYLKKYGGKADYIHGDETARHLGSQPGNIAFLFAPMAKSQLFPTVIADGALPRKTFSMGHAYEKRYYLESRRIR